MVIHGKRFHEETRATFSHARTNAPVVVVRGLEEAVELGQVIRGQLSRAQFLERFADHYSDGFDPDVDLTRVGVVNQTTMLATETKAIAATLRQAMVDCYGESEINDHFADTSDTLCYATNENQSATMALIEHGGDLALIVGGFNSSNTSHLVELCEQAMPTYFISDEKSITSIEEIRHYDVRRKALKTTSAWMPRKGSVDIALTAGASCPDALLDRVVKRVISWFDEARSIEDVLAPFQEPANA